MAISAGFPSLTRRIFSAGRGAGRPAGQSPGKGAGQGPGKGAGQGPDQGAGQDADLTPSNPGSTNRAAAARNLTGPSLVPARQLGLLLSVEVPAAATVAVAGFWPIWQHDLPLAVSSTVLALAILTIGVVLLAEPGQTAPGLALLASGLLYIASWSNEWLVGPLPFISTAVGNLWVLAGGWAVYSYPDHILTAWERLAFRIIFAWFAVTPWCSAIFSRPEWHQFPADGWWPTIWPDRHVDEVLARLTNLGTLMFAATYILAWITRLKLARPAERKLKTPTSIAALIAAVLASALPFGQVIQASESTIDGLYVLSALGVLTIPVAFLVSVLRRQFARTSLASLVPRLYSEADPAGMQQALRDALEDPTLTLGVWSAARRDYLDIDQQPIGETGRFVVSAESADGARVAALFADPALGRDPTLLDAAATAVGLTLQNAVLLDTVRAQYTELRAASTRVAKSADAERRRLEMLLHDGAQQHFLALGLMIGATEACASDASTVAAMQKMRAQLEHALAELRQLARGLHPNLLRMGLAAATKDTLRRYPVPVQVDLPDGSLPQATETTAFYAICELVANSVKHAEASAIRVCGSMSADVLHISIEDDGRGGAFFGSGGSGLDSIRDRLTALGGSIRITNTSGVGTCIQLEIPCV